MAQGMLRQGQEALVKSTVDDMLCLIDRYGYMPNGNAEGLLGRSQPPFLRMMRRLLSCGLNRYGYEVAEQGTDLGLRVAQRVPGLDYTGWTQEKIAESIMADAESGWDFSPRCEQQQLDCVYVDLNAISYGMERNMAAFAQILDNGEAPAWQEAAEKRLHLMRTLLFDGEVYRD